MPLFSIVATAVIAFFSAAAAMMIDDDVDLVLLLLLLAILEVGRIDLQMTSIKIAAIQSQIINPQLGLI